MTSADVDRYLAGLTTPWPAEAAKAAVAAIRTGGKFEEAIKWSHPYFACSGRAVLKLHVARGWINIFFYRGAELNDPDHLLSNGGTSGMRRLRLERDAPLPVVQIQELSRQAANISH
ncbi:protein of unknown function (DU1801) [Quadrisphaera granulorum]|uniref:Uncharacterized protein DUF1801 n=1 Tax=Quadrisphaera granulorum TaxID=317664 RepID=A0A316A756_9ACTN|nr:DUF1801 domain-containing protein [Quadrisphaera granulorum]PWJ53279.1 uncharacterized protein DUF1801 [Quadrisphaera granulorum]SZE96953.1 protein of unknown function (DU1801) [Quadrisphaera granulorum]